MTKRNCGILLHISSLPGEDGIGTLGEDAYRFIDFLKETGQGVWQILPLGPPGAGNSPYQCYSAFAGNPLMIDLKILAEDGIIDSGIIANRPRFVKKRTDFIKVEKWKIPILLEAFQHFRNTDFHRFQQEYWRFLDEQSWWLHDYALFISARKHFEGTEWKNWPESVKYRQPEALKDLTVLLSEEIEFQKFLQFIFFRQWHKLKNYANQNGIEILGDVPLYVSGESVDVWANTDIFKLDEKLEPIEVGGVPPDYFSETGQLWGNPVFDWEKLKQREFDWWIARMHFNLKLFDRVRIDHFRGLESFWAIPAKEKTAIRGYWLPSYGDQFLSMLKNQLEELPFIAEDLGIITDEVENLRKKFKLPGMRVLQFAFSEDETNRDLPHNFVKNTVVYTGTHDNNTTLGWLQSANDHEKKMVIKYTSDIIEIQYKKIIEMTLASVAKTAIIPMQDFLELGSDARMNIPGTAVGNWSWRFQWNQVKQSQKNFLRTLTEKYNR